MVLEDEHRRTFVSQRKAAMLHCCHACEDMHACLSPRIHACGCKSCCVLLLQRLAGCILTRLDAVGLDETLLPLPFVLQPATPKSVDFLSPT